MLDRRLKDTYFRLRPNGKRREGDAYNQHLSRFAANVASHCTGPDDCRNNCSQRILEPPVYGFVTVEDLRSFAWAACQSISIVPCSVLWKYCEHTSQPLSGRSSDMQHSNIKGSVVTRCIHKGKSSRVGNQIPKARAGTAAMV